MRQGPGLGLNTGAPTDAVFDLVTYTGELDFDLMENADAQAHVYNTGTLPLNWNWLITANPNNSAAATAVAFKSGGFQPSLQVTPAANIAASGLQGGPFIPASFQYQLRATTGSLHYSIAGIPSWLRANITLGTVTTTPVTVTFSLVNVGRLAPGAYTGTIAFANTDTGIGSTTRAAILTVNPRRCEDREREDWEACRHHDDRDHDDDRDHQDRR